MGNIIYQAQIGWISQFLTLTEGLNVVEHPNFIFPPKIIPSRRNDQHSLSQNIASKVHTFVCKFLGEQNRQDYKGKVKQKYGEYLKRYGIRNSQMILLFAFLFMKQSNANKTVYSEFYSHILAYLQSKLAGFEGKNEQRKEKMRVKIEANILILNYLFGLGESCEVDWEQLQRLGQPLFTGKQQAGIKSALLVGKKIEKGMHSCIQIDSSSSNQLELHLQ